jgi:hypothetical protein
MTASESVELESLYTTTDSESTCLSNIYIKNALLELWPALRGVSYEAYLSDCTNILDFARQCRIFAVVYEVKKATEELESAKYNEECSSSVLASGSSVDAMRQLAGAQCTGLAFYSTRV